MISHDGKLTFHLLTQHTAQTINNLFHCELSLLKMSVVPDITIISPILISHIIIHWISAFQKPSKQDFVLEGTKKITIFRK